MTCIGIEENISITGKTNFPRDKEPIVFNLVTDLFMTVSPNVHEPWICSVREFDEVKSKTSWLLVISFCITDKRNILFALMIK